MWVPWVPSEWIAAVVTQCFVYEWNEYYFQSKNPKRFDDPGLLPGHFIFGTTIETDYYPAGFKTKAPPIFERWEAMLKLRGQRTFVTIEPIMDFRPDKLASMIYEIKPEFVNIGADSKGHGLVEPPWEKVELLISELNKFVEVRQKKNLDRLRGK